MEPVTFTPFEVGQLYAALGTRGMAMLSPELRLKLKDAFHSEQADSSLRDAYYYATDEGELSSTLEPTT